MHMNCVFVPLHVTKAHSKRAYIPPNLHSFLTLALEGDDWPDSSPGCFIPGESTQIPIALRLCGQQSRSRFFGEETISVPGLFVCLVRTRQTGRPKISLSFSVPACWFFGMCFFGSRTFRNGLFPTHYFALITRRYRQCCLISRHHHPHPTHPPIISGH
jgi:hypothetical protein